MNKQDLYKELDLIVGIAKCNGYEENLILKLVQKWSDTWQCKHLQ